MWDDNKDYLFLTWLLRYRTLISTVIRKTEAAVLRPRRMVSLRTRKRDVITDGLDYEDLIPKGITYESIAVRDYTV